MAPIGQVVAEYDDVLTDNYVTGTISVGTSQVQAKVGASNLSGREMLYLENQGAQTVYYGPSGVTTTTGAVLYKFQSVFLPVGANVNVYVIAASGTNTIIVQEFA